MKVMTMGSPATEDIFNYKVNRVYNEEYEVEHVKMFYTLGHLLSDYAKIHEFSRSYKDNERLYKFWNWNYEDNFWKKLETFQPDVLILDLFPEVYFGDIELPDGTNITRNFRLAKISSTSNKIVDKADKDFPDLTLQQFRNFEARVKDLAPQTKMVVNAPKFASRMSKDGEIADSYDEALYPFNDKQINSYNRVWKKIDQMLENSGVSLIRFDDQFDASESTVKKPWYYYYNQNYYTDALSQIEEFAQANNLGPTITRLDINQLSSPESYHQDVILLDVPKSGKDLRIFRNNSTAKQVLREFAHADYTVDGRVGKAFRLITRKRLGKRNHQKYKDVHFRVIPPKDEFEYGDHRLLVRFLSFGPSYRSLSNFVFNRNFFRDFSTLKDSVVKNTYILEIGDVNLINGSFYANTPNFPEFESQIQELIEKFRKLYQVKRINVVMYGASRGGMGALLHGAIGDYKFLAADPVFNEKAYLTTGDPHFLKGNRISDFTSRISKLLNLYSNKDNGIVLGSSNIGITFSNHMRLPLGSITLLDYEVNVFDHTLFNVKTVPIQLSFVNHLLIKDSLMPVNIPKDVVLELKYLKNDAVNFDQVDSFRVRIEDKDQNDSAVYTKFRDRIKEIYVLYHQDTNFEYYKRV